MANETAAIIAVFQEVADSFGKLDLARFRRCYRLPSLAVTPQGVTALNTEADFMAFFGTLTAGLQSRGFARSQVLEQYIRLQAETIAFASLLWVRYKADGAELERLGASYTLVKTAGDWKIVMLTAHAAERVLRLA